MKTLLIAVAMIIASQAHADQSFYLNGKEITKIEALKALLANKDANVSRCSQVELTEKATFKNRKAKED